MAIKQDKFGIKEVMDVTFYDLETFRPVLYANTLKLSNLENTAEESHARGGKGNPILLTWDYNREASFTIQDALVAFDGLALLTGNEITSTNETMYAREPLKEADRPNFEVSNIADPGEEPAWVANIEVELKETPLSGRLFVYDAYTGIAGGHIAHDITGKTLTVATSLLANDPETNKKGIVAYYPYTNTQTDKQIVTITSDNFPGYYRIVGDTFIRSANTGQDEMFQLIVERAKVEPGFSITMESEGDPSVFDYSNIVVYDSNIIDYDLVNL